MRMMSKLGSRNSRSSSAETTSAKKSPTTSPHTILLRAETKVPVAAEKSGR
jgi:hypothetical protein